MVCIPVLSLHPSLGALWEIQWNQADTQFRSPNKQFCGYLGPYYKTEKDLTLENKYQTYLLFRKASGAIMNSP